MREFFHGWRRKAGCVALVMACAMMVFWFRSYVVSNAICYLGRDRDHRVALESGHVSWSRSVSDYSLEGSPAGPDLRPHWISFPIPYEYPDPEPDVIEYRYQWAGFKVETVVFNYEPPARVSALQIPCWSIVLPLTLLSAYLFLWKPRPKPKGEPNA